MKQINTWSFAALLATLMVPGSVAIAQQPDGNFQAGPHGGGFGGGPQGGGFQGADGRGPQGGMLPGQTVSAVTTPLSTLSSALTLTSDEASQIQTIQSDFRQQLRTIAPPPTAGGFGDTSSGPTPPDAAARAKIEDLATSESAQIVALLTPSQQSSLTTLIGQLKELKAAQISPRLYSQLNLTSDQFTQISKIEATANDGVKSAALKAIADNDYDRLDQALQDAHTQVHTQVVALLDSTQAALVQSDRGGRGGFRSARATQGQGGFGGGQGGGFGGQDGGPGGLDGGPGDPGGPGEPGDQGGMPGGGPDDNNQQQGGNTSGAF